MGMANLIPGFFTDVNWYNSVSKENKKNKMIKDIDKGKDGGSGNITFPRVKQTALSYWLTMVMKVLLAGALRKIATINQICIYDRVTTFMLYMLYFVYAEVGGRGEQEGHERERCATEVEESG